MAKRKAKRYVKKSKGILKLIATALVTGVGLTVFGLVFSALAGMLGTWLNFVQGIVAVALWGIGAKMRKGKESFVETAPYVLSIGIVYQLLERMPFQIPFLKFAVEWSLEGLILTFGMVWMAEAIVDRIM